MSAYLSKCDTFFWTSTMSILEKTFMFFEYCDNSLFTCWSQFNAEIFYYFYFILSDVKIYLGEKTLQWFPLGCHIVLLSQDVHVWMYSISNFWKIFTIFLHIMLEYNLGKRLKKKLFHFIL
jgi:hypothetical protein